jgi:regulator of PEP synthase PpsR (kinase-PPPase family)
MPERTVFFVSDGTGITAETFGNSILAQFAAQPRHVRRPSSTASRRPPRWPPRSTTRALREGKRPIVFITLVRDEVRDIIASPRCKGLVLDMFRTFVEPLEVEFGVKSNHRIGRFSDASQSEEYHDRIEAINFSLAHDDGQSSRNLDIADVILVGVSRSGKTPTSLYLAMQHGIKAANYPLIPDDFERGKLPSIAGAAQAQVLRADDRPRAAGADPPRAPPGQPYASIENCRYEVNEAEAMMRREGIAWLSSTHKSIEEIATTILRDLRPDRLIY